MLGISLMLPPDCIVSVHLLPLPPWYLLPDAPLNPTLRARPTRHIIGRNAATGSTAPAPPPQLHLLVCEA